MCQAIFCILIINLQIFCKKIGYFIAIFWVLLYYNNVKECKLMTKLSKEKLNQFKIEKGYSNAKIAELTGLQVATVDKIFCGANKNPTLETLKKITELFNCTVDELLEYEEAPSTQYYRDKETGKLAQEIFENPELKILLDASKELEVADLNAVIEIVKRMKKTK